MRVTVPRLCRLLNGIESGRVIVIIVVGATSSVHRVYLHAILILMGGLRWMSMGSVRIICGAPHL